MHCKISEVCCKISEVFETWCLLVRSIPGVDLTGASIYQVYTP